MIHPQQYILYSRNSEINRIKNILIRRKESDTYLATVSRHRWSLLLQLMKATVLAEIYTFYLLSSRPALSSDVYWQYPGRCRSLSFLLIYFLSFYLSRYSFYRNKYKNDSKLTLWTVRMSGKEEIMPLYKWSVSPRGSQSSFGCSSNNFPMSLYVSPVVLMASIKFFLSSSKTLKQ